MSFTAMDFSKKHLRDTSNREDFRQYRREVFHDYAAYLKDLIHSNYDLSVKFVIWLKQYLAFIRNEKTFNASYLPRFQRGQVVFINLGFRIGHELGGPHYGIVLDSDNRKKDGLITIVPMISQKPRHTERGVKPWEYRLPIPISHLIIQKAAKLIDLSPASPVTHDILDSVHRLSSMDEHTQIKQLPILLKEFEQKLHRRIAPLIAFAEKMNRGSIIDTHQVITVSKQRIITPTKRSDNLYDICIPPEIMSDISKMIFQNYIEVERLDKSSQKV